MFKLGDLARYWRAKNTMNPGGAVDATVTQVHDDGAVGVSLHDDSTTVFDRVEVHGPDTAPADGHYVEALVDAPAEAENGQPDDGGEGGA